MTPVNCPDIKRIQEAKACLRRVLELKPDGALASASLAQLCDSTNDDVHTKVTDREVYDALHVGEWKLSTKVDAQLLPEQRASILSAREAWNEGHTDQAIALLMSLRSAAQATPAALYDSAIMLAYVGRLAEAIEVQAEAVAAAPADVDLLMNYSDYLGRVGRHSEAIRVAEKVIHAAPDSASSWFVLAEALFRANRITQARDVARHAAILSPPFSWPMIRGQKLMQNLGTT